MRDRADPGDSLVELFAELVELDARAREAALAERELDPLMRAELEGLLIADSEAATNPILSPGWLARLAPPPASRIGERVGDYRLTELIGSGGMGDVYAAERVAGDFDQKVAIKLVRADLASPAVLARFDDERQLLARLGHPNIAALFGGGVAGDRPYLVMEAVEGAPLDRHVAERAAQGAIDLDGRLDLFAAICDAVEHAHGKLVVHCDLKPDNVMVTPAGEVKLLDFGVATALGSGAGERAAAAMTPAYAAPELVRGGAISTAADVYSLGVILYELSSGRPPHDLAGLAPSEIADRVATAPPPAGVSPDLDAICARALALDPERRYPSVAALAADVAASRAHRPVAARGGGFAEVAGKFVRRHRVVLAAAALAIAVLAGLIGYSTRRIAAERDRARLEAERAQASSDLIVGLFSGADPAVARGEPLSVRQLLVRGRARLDADLADQPAERARLLEVLGRVHTNLGHYEDAEEALAEAVAIHRRIGADPETTATTLLALGNARREQTELGEAERDVREAHALLVARHGPRSLAAARALVALSEVQIDSGDYSAAFASASEALELRRALGASRQIIGQTLASVGDIHLSRGDNLAAERALSEAVAIIRVAVGAVHPDTSGAVTSLAVALRRQGRYDEAEPLYREALSINRELYPGDHPDIAHNLNHLGRLQFQRGDYGSAEPFLLEGLEMRRRLYGRGHAAVAASLGSLAQLHAALERYDPAIELAREAHDIVRGLYDRGHPHVAGSLSVLARITAASGARREAIDLYRQTIELRRAAPEPDLAAIARTRVALAQLLCETGARREGREALARAPGAPSAPGDVGAELTRARAACSTPGGQRATR